MFSISKRPSVARPLPQSEQVRALWVDFEVWHAAQLQEIEHKIKVALKDLDQKWRATKSRRPKKDSKELEEEKTKTRLELESTLHGNVVRQEWDRRLRDASLVSEDWVDMTDEEQRKVEMILGADLEFEEDEPHRFPGSYAVVDPSSFHSLDDAWLEVKQNMRSDDQVSLDASTSSASSTSEAWNTPAYALWSSEASRSSAQSSQTSSPEWHSNKYLPSDASSAPSSRPSTSTSMSSDTRSKSHGHYIGPQLTSDTEDEETSFEKWKLAIRIQKIREFHDEAVDADIRLTRDLDDARRKKNWKKEEEAQRVLDHESKMLALRESKEAERKAAVELERQRRRAELLQPPPMERDLTTPGQKLLKTFQVDRDSPSVSDTPTIRQSAFVRTRKQSLSHLQHQEWPESGNDTPTPTARTSAWNFKKQSIPSTSGGDISTFGDAPPLKRLATVPASDTSTLGSHSHLSHSSTVFGESASNSAAKVAAGPILESTVTTKDAPKAVTTTDTSMSSSSKKSKKEKAKAGKKIQSSVIEKKDNNDEKPLGVSMPGQWGWGGDPTAISASSAVSGKLSTGSTISFLNSTPSTSSIPTLPTPSSHPGPYSYSFGAPGTFNTPMPTHSVSAPPPVYPTTSATAIQTQLPDNRRVWFPPETNSRHVKAKQPTQTILDVPTSAPAVQLENSVTSFSNVPGNGTSSNVATSMHDMPMSTRTTNSVSRPPALSSMVEPTAPPVTTTASALGGQVGGHREAPGVKLDPPSTSKVTHTSSVPPTKPASAPSVLSASTAHQSSSASAPTSSSSKKKSKGKKKVTIEEAQDEESGSGPNVLLKGKSLERLPVDSRYIIEPISEPEAPKPVVPEPQAQEMFREIYEYKSSEVPSISASASTSSMASDDLHQQAGYSFWSPSAASTASSSASSLPQNDHKRWLPSGGTDQSLTSSSSLSLPQNDYERWSPGSGAHDLRQDRPEKRVRWTPSAYAYDAPDAAEAEQPDGFLSILNSLEAVVKGSAGDPINEQSAVVGGTGKREANKKAQNRSKPETNTDETFWQHAMASLGRGGNNISAPSAM
ncbi:hypothetical protein J3R30DRAFT_3553824 [Lentinula aciculospora]|uniref:Uncharacterized protein n=1 Tax=Lentinula aciculospora TaxID=153920 RepID=A0A9W8ZWR2_9AGAR|nr:hypothetical protein J3R30DRAFT_3553824 [Lentinula aciculospora]